MRKSFALCEAFGLTPFPPCAGREPSREDTGTVRPAAPCGCAREGETAPFPSPWIPSAREGLSAGKLPPTQPSVAERHALTCTALHAAQCKCRYGRLRRGEELKEAGGRRPPASLGLTPPPAKLPPPGRRSRSQAGGATASWHCAHAAQCQCRYGLLREGQGWGWRTTTAVRHAPVARP